MIPGNNAFGLIVKIVHLQTGSFRPVIVSECGCFWFPNELQNTREKCGPLSDLYGVHAGLQVG